MKLKLIIFWVLRIVAAFILIQTLFFKFSAAPESVALFSLLGMEPWGRISIGILELIAAVLILIPKTTVWGACLAVGLMLGALYFHLTILGIKWQGDYILFSYAILVLISSLILVFCNWQQIVAAWNVVKEKYNSAASSN